jgi:hypothetical protein
MSLDNAIDTLYLYLREAWEASGKNWPYGGRKEIRDLWQTLNPGSWDRNDWVAAYTFRRVEK